MQFLVHSLSIWCLEKIHSNNQFTMNAHSVSLNQYSKVTMVQCLLMDKQVAVKHTR